MRRRDLLALLTLSAGLRTAQARARERRYRLAFAAGVLPAGRWREMPLWRVVLAELRRLGYVEGGSLTIEAFSAEGHIELYADLAQKVADRNPDVIVSAGHYQLISTLKALETAPIVAAMGIPLESGLVTSLARPGGNLTGVTMDAGSEIWGKQLQILTEAVPTASRIALLATQADRIFLNQARPETSGKLGLTLVGAALEDATPPAIARGFAELARRRPDALLVDGDYDLAARSRQIVDLANEARLPAMYPYGDYVEAGGLMEYGPNPSELGRYMAEAVHRILDGTKPGDIPIYQPTSFELVINKKAAAGIGLKVSSALLARADKVIE